MLTILAGVILGALCSIMGIFIGWTMAMEAFKVKVLNTQDQTKNTKN